MSFSALAEASGTPAWIRFVVASEHALAGKNPDGSGLFQALKGSLMQGQGACRRISRKTLIPA
jgi:hypothetical protein